MDEAVVTEPFTPEIQIGFHFYQIVPRVLSLKDYTQNIQIGHSVTMLDRIL